MKYIFSRLSILIIFTILSIESIGQNNLTLGIQSSLDYYDNSFWGFPKIVDMDSMTFNFPEGNHRFKQKTNYSAGIKGEYYLNRILGEFAIGYSSKDYIVDYDMDYYSTSNNGLTIIYKPIDYSVLRFRYIDIDLGLGYEIINSERISIIPKVSFKTAFLIKSESLIKYKNQENEIIDKNNTDYLVKHIPNKFLYAMCFDLTLYYKLKNIRFGISPSYAIYLNQITPIPMNKNPYQYSVKLSIMFNIKNKNDEK